MSFTPSEPEKILPKLKSETITSIVKKGIRLDGRGLQDFRPFKIIPGYLPKAQGSALVKLGNTQVLVGVKLEVGTPYPDAPDEGVIIVSAEFVPMASPVFEPGPPDENAIELARVIDRSIRETHAIDLKKLTLIPGKKVWTVWIDIYVLDHDGNLMDASSIATLAALMNTKVPKATVTEEGEVIIDKESYEMDLPLTKKVVTVTLGKIDSVLLVDPDYEEEAVLNAKITIAVTDDGLIAGIQKAGQSSITKEEVLKAVEISLQKGNEIINKVVEEASEVKELIKPEEKKESEELEESKSTAEAAEESKEDQLEKEDKASDEAAKDKEEID